MLQRCEGLTKSDETRYFEGALSEGYGLPGDLNGCRCPPSQPRGVMLQERREKICAGRGKNSTGRYGPPSTSLGCCHLYEAPHKIKPRKQCRKKLNTFFPFLMFFSLFFLLFFFSFSLLFSFLFSLTPHKGGFAKER